MRIELQVIGSSLRAIAEEMGAALVRAAFSPNIKERRDCSTALFDERGRMIAQAEHIPIHLGAMPESVAAVMELEPKREALYILNDPFTGGSHLPDMTLVSRTPVGFAVSRAHHADIGGMEPASLPALSRELYQEGLILPPVELTDEVDPHLPRERPQPRRAARRPARPGRRAPARRAPARPSSSSAAALEHGAGGDGRALRLLGTAGQGLRSPGFPTDAARRSTCSRRSRASSSSASPSTIAGDEIAIDFAGTAPQHEGNLNCPLSVTRSACYFVVRCLTDPDVPASGGAFAPVHGQRAAPAASSTPCRPRRWSPGTSRRRAGSSTLVFAAFAAFIDVPAQGQGTINNMAFGNDGFTYYETVGGGQGACAHADGPSAVHVDDLEHAEHAYRGARARLSASRRALRPPARLGRRGRAPGRRRGHPLRSAYSRTAAARS